MEPRREGRARPTGARIDRDSGAPSTPRTRRPRRTADPDARAQRSAPVSTRAHPGTRHTSAEIHAKPRADKPASGKSRSGPPRTAPWPGRPRVSNLNLGRGLVALLTVVVLGITGFAWSSVNGLTNSITMLNGLDLGGKSDGATDILLVGTDSRVDAKGNPLSADELKWLRVGDDITTSTDTILLIRVPNDGSAATAISIPRDSYVEVPGIGMSKINAAYGATREAARRQAVEAGKSESEADAIGTRAGRKALIETVSHLTGVTVDHYAEVGLLGFALLTDAVGGVDVCLKNAVDEPLSGARFKAGRQTLNGPKALSFVRQRHDLPRGDLDRITRQQVYMASLAAKILSTGTLTNPSKLEELQKAVSRSVVIDDGWDIIKFADQLKDLSGGNVKFNTIPVVSDHGWSDDGTQSVVTVDPEKVKTWVDRQLGNGSTQTSGRGAYRVDVVNAGTVDGLAANVAGLLTAKGYQQGKTESKPINEFNSIVFARSKDSDGAKQLVKDLGGDIEIREDSSLGDDQLRAVLTNTYTGLGAIWNTGPQGDHTNNTAEQDPATTQQSAPIKADTDGPVCVN
ncbi:MAG: LCP family protein [Gordonia sp. (in: high G+C Gram-positive bacteria)]